MKRHYKIKYCKICEKKIKTHSKNYGHTERKRRIESEDGVLFNGCIWFCNECWAELIKHWREDEIRRR